MRQRGVLAGVTASGEQALRRYGREHPAELHPSQLHPHLPGPVTCNGDGGSPLQSAGPGVPLHEEGAASRGGWAAEGWDADQRCTPRGGCGMPEYRPRLHASCGERVLQLRVEYARPQEDGMVHDDEPCCHRREASGGEKALGRILHRHTWELQCSVSCVRHSNECNGRLDSTVI
jgi:hypothetical protein